jgi:hypothetical protein
MPQLQRLANHAHQVLAQPVRAGLPAQPWRRTRPGSLLGEHFLHYFSVEIPRGDRGVRTSEKAPSPHSGAWELLVGQLVLLGKAYPANDAPGVEVARELALVFVARHQHDDAPIVDVLQVYWGRGTQIA